MEKRTTVARRSLLVALLAVAATAAGCGYALVGRGSNIPASIRSVYLQPLENRTSRSQAEQFLTRAIAEELVTRHRFTLANSAGEADAELSGAVVGFGLNPVAFDSDGRATEYEITITAQMAFKSLADDKVLWSNDHYLFRENYSVDVSEGTYFDREDVALQDASKRFAETMVSDLLEGF